MRRETDPTRSSVAALTREVWLKGQPNLPSYVRYCQSAVQEPVTDRQGLIAEWLAANLRFEALAETEAGLPDQIETRDIGLELQPLVEEVRADVRFRETFNTVPTRFAWVELDKLIVSQRHIDLDQVDRLRARLGENASAESLFRFALPLDRKEAPVEMRKQGSGRYLFSSQSADFRFHRASLLKPEQITDYDAFGNMSAVLGLIVGFGSNFLNVIESDQRMVIHDGHHRAYALRAAGVRHAPCIVQTVSHREELGLIASSEVAGSPVFYFKAPRPPVLKDFFDPELRKEMLVRKLSRAIEIEFKVREYETADGFGGD